MESTNNAKSFKMSETNKNISRRPRQTPFHVSLVLSRKPSLKVPTQTRQLLGGNKLQRIHHHDNNDNDNDGHSHSDDNGDHYHDCNSYVNDLADLHILYD